MDGNSTCPYCDVALEEKESPYMMSGIYLGRFTFLVCRVCRRRYHPRETSEEIEAAAKERGLWGVEVAAVQDQEPEANLDEEFATKYMSSAGDTTIVFELGEADETGESNPKIRSVYSRPGDETDRSNPKKARS